jgi:hypothetical protein
MIKTLADYYILLIDKVSRKLQDLTNFFPREKAISLNKLDV